MARRYSRREFLMDASFMAGGAILLKLVAPENSAKSETAMSQTATQQEPFIVSGFEMSQHDEKG